MKLSTLFNTTQHTHLLAFFHSHIILLSIYYVPSTLLAQVSLQKGLNNPLLTLMVY